MDNAFNYILKNGIASEDDYPYKGVDGTCNKSVKRTTPLTKYVDVPEGDTN